MTTDAVFTADPYARACEATVIAVNDRGGIVLDRTVFYPTGGGQPGDSGVLTVDDGPAIEVATTVKGDAPGEIVHVPAAGSTLPEPGARVTAEIDWQRRHRLMRIHTCLHLLSAVLPYPVTGGQIGDGKGRLDFDIPEGGLDKDEITGRLNALIAEDHGVTSRWITDEELAAQPDLVKTMSVRPPAGADQVRLIDIASLDLQPCGGTHVKRTGEIGPVVVTKIENKGRQNRRVAIAFA